MVVAQEDIMIRHNHPAKPQKEFTFEETQLFGRNAPNGRIIRVSPKLIRQTFGSYSRCCDEESVSGERVDCESWVEGADSVNVIYH